MTSVTLGSLGTLPAKATASRASQGPYNCKLECLGRSMLSLDSRSSTQPLHAPSCSHPTFSHRKTLRHGIRARATAGEQPNPEEQIPESEQPHPEEQIPENDASRAILEEIAAEDALAAEQLQGKEPVYDVYPNAEVVRLSPKQQRERQANLTGRPLRSVRAYRQPSRRSVDVLDARQQPETSSMGTLAKALDLRPQLPLPPVPRLEPLAAKQEQPDSDLPYVPRQDDSEGIGSYARKIAQAGLDLSANPRDVVYYHPMASKARLDAAVAAGYDPDAEFRAKLERQITGDELEDAELDGAEVDEDRQRPQGHVQPQSMTPDLDSDFNEQLSEEERQLEEDIMNPEWDADMDVKHDEEEDSLAEDFGGALSETMALKEENDREGFAVWEGDAEEADSIDDIVSRLAETSDDRESGRDGETSSTTAGQRKGDLISRKPTFSWRDFGPSRTRQKD